ncbi:MAG: hypothetical protein KDC69_11590 [Flavobacteriaceae bacterium]|nr:hypothetical protein [Flavobacteriaceae bacterium]
MKKSIYVLTMLFITLFSCSSDDNSSEDQQLETTNFKITISGVINGNFSNYPEPTDNSLKVDYLIDSQSETEIYTEALTNELMIQKEKTIEASNLLGVQMSILTVDTDFGYIEVKIENLDTNEVVVDEQLEKYLVYENPDTQSSLEITVIFDVLNSNITIED